MDHKLSSGIALSILIVNYNGKKFLGPCFDSIRKYADVPHEVIVVDNASQDGSVDYLKQNYPGVHVVSSAVNLGFAGGNNLAAQNANGKYLLLLNNDTEIRSSIRPVIGLMDERADAGVLGCRLFYADKRQQESVGYFPTVLSLILSWLPFAKRFPNVSWLRRLVRLDSQLYKQSCAEADWVSGAFLLTRTGLWHKLHGMDANYFMYMEDIDYCRRIQEGGHKILYSANCEVIHYEGSGRPWIGRAAVVNSVNSYLVYLEKFHGWFAVFVLCLFLPPVFLLRGVCHSLTNLLGFDPYGLEKARTYCHAARRLAVRIF